MGHVLNTILVTFTLHEIPGTHFMIRSTRELKTVNKIAILTYMQAASHCTPTDPN